MRSFPILRIALVTNQSLMPWAISVAMGLSSVNDSTHFFLLLFCKLYVPRRPILFEACCFGRTRDGDHALRSDPGQSDLRGSATLPRCKLFDLFNDG